MRSLSKTEAGAWCLAQNVPLGSRGLPARPSAAEDFPIPEDAGQKVALVAGHLVRHREAASLLVWFTEWGVWPSGERAHIFERFRLSYGESRPLVEVPAFAFSAAEFEDAASFVTLGVLFLWDIFLVASPQPNLLHYSHDEVGWRAT